MNEIRETIIGILQDLHEDVDFENETRLIDGKILDSFDIVTLISELSPEQSALVEKLHNWEYYRIMDERVK